MDNLFPLSLSAIQNWISKAISVPSHGPTTKTLNPATKAFSHHVNFLSSTKYSGICVDGRRRCSSGALTVKAVSISSTGCLSSLWISKLLCLKRRSLSLDRTSILAEVEEISSLYY